VIDILPTFLREPSSQTRITDNLLHQIVDFKVRRNVHTRQGLTDSSQMRRTLRGDVAERVIADFICEETTFVQAVVNKSPTVISNEEGIDYLLEYHVVTTAVAIHDTSSLGICDLRRHSLG
jgi:hypothetical protein